MRIPTCISSSAFEGLKYQIMSQQSLLRLRRCDLTNTSRVTNVQSWFHRTSSSSSKKLLGSASSLVSSSIKNSIHTAATAANAATSSAAGMARMLLDRQEDGQPHSAGFVTFKNLRAAQAAKQMLQYPEPFAMEVLEAPQPEGTSCHFCCCFVRFGSRRKMSFPLSALHTQYKHASNAWQKSPFLCGRCLLEKCWQNARGTRTW